MKLTNRETASLCRSLALLLHGGVSLAEGVFLLEQEETGERKALLGTIRKAMEAGSTLSAAAAQTRAFPTGVSAMLAIGEETGTLEETLTHLADYHDQRHRSALRLKNALTYPALLLLLMLCVIGVLLVQALPVFAQVYGSLGSGMRGLSAGLLSLGQALQRLLPVLFGLLALGAALAAALMLHGGFRERCLGVLRRRFGDRGISRKFSNARFARGLAMAMASGLQLEEAVALAGKLLSDLPGAASRCARCEALLGQGEDLATALTAAELLTPAQSRLLAVGIRGGNADRVMDTLAEGLMEEAEEALDNFSSRVEPALVLLASLLVGVFLLSVMLPLVDIMSTIG